MGWGRGRLLQDEAGLEVGEGEAGLEMSGAHVQA